MRRVVIRPEAIEGDRVRLDAEEAHHLARVLRLGPGAVLEAADGRGRVLTVQLERLGRGEAWARILGESDAARESPCEITLAQAVLKGERMSWLVQKATELGVTRLVPVETARVVARLSADRTSGRQRRWERLAREAVKQCGRGRVPVIEPPCPLPAVLAEARAHDAAWLCWEGGGASLGLLAREAGRPRRLLLLVGPEGGFTADEVTGAEAAGARLVSLGPRILRAESAGVVALAVCQYLFGDLGSASA